jgi:hypothetical protein
MLETLYKSAKPETSVWEGEYYCLQLNNPADGSGFKVTELHGWWDDAGRSARNNTVTLNPEEGWPTFEEAFARYKQQKLHRAKEGFIHCYWREMPEGNEMYRILDVAELEALCSIA